MMKTQIKIPNLYQKLQIKNQKKQNQIMMKRKIMKNLQI